MFEKLGEVEEKFEAIEERLADPNVVQNPQEYQQLAKQHSDLSDVVAKWREYKSIRKQLADMEEMLSGRLDEDMREMAQAELEELKGKIPDLEQDLRLMLLPKDPNDIKDVIVEIRAGTGGEEAGLFCADLLRMYTRYAERQGWQADLMSAVDTGIGGYKEAVLEIKGKGAYSKLKFEAGIHRVQRVPATESSGRIHTSAATVSVLAAADEVDVHISSDDLEIDTYRSAGAGGQNVQKNETAIRITHKPSGIVVTCQDERSQFQNKERALKILSAKLLENAQNEQQQEIASIRRLMVGSGDRSEKIRTYNFPQNRITDHRIGHDIFNLPGFLDGEITDMIDRLTAVDQAEKLKASISQ